MLLPVLAGLGALSMMSNPRRRKRRRRNPESDALAKARAIQQQIGGRALFMIGAKQLSGGADNGKPYLAFKIGRNAKGVNFVKIVLEPSDTYTMEFIKTRGMSYKVVQTFTDVYAEDLNRMIELGTGMVTSLGTMGRNPRVSKTKLVYVLQGNYGYGWDDLLEEETYREAKAQAKVYRENERNASHRVITRRVPIEATNPRRRRAKRRK